MPATSTKRISFDEFMAMEVPVGEKWELIDGEIFKTEVLPFGRGGRPPVYVPSG